LEVRIHNISPLLAKQLVLKLKVRVGLLEWLQLLPRCFRQRRTFPPDQQLPRIPGWLGAHDRLWYWNSSAAHNLRQWRSDFWQCAFEFLEEGGVEHTVNPCLRWQLQPICYGTDPFNDLIQPEVLGCQLG
jgi:hypothetical protein